MRPTIALVLLAAACGGPANEQPGPRGLRADQHINAAARENARADELTHWPDTRPGGDGTNITQQAAAGAWYGTWDTVDEHRRRAQFHRSAAAQLETEYEQACGEAPYAEVSVSPLQRYGVGSYAIPNGTMVLLRPEAGPPERLLAAMRCHRAWMMLGRTDMGDCPLDLPSIHVAARGDAEGIEIDITVADPLLVPELRRRAAHDLEAAQSRR